MLSLIMSRIGREETDKNFCIRNALLEIAAMGRVCEES